MRSTLVALLVTVAASSAAGQIKGPAEVSVAVGRLASVPLTIDADEVKYEVLGGDCFDSFREFSTPTELRLRVLGYANGTGYIVVSAVKGGKLMPLVVVKVVVGNGPGPGPKPPDPPGPVGPISPLAKAFKDAAAKDGWDKLPDLAIGLRACGELAKPGVTAVKLQGLTAVALKSAVPVGVPANVRGVLEGELAALDVILPASAPDATLTEATATTVKTLFLKLAVACEGK